jgi:membrane protease YdiL (CAAX protease family)
MWPYSCIYTSVALVESREAEVGLRGFVRRFPLVTYFGLAYAFSLTALVVIGLPDLSGRSPVPSSSFVMFPVLVVGVGLTGVVLTAVVGGGAGLRELWGRVARWRLGVWALALLIPPVGITAVLAAFRLLVSPAFAQHLDPTFAAIGIGIGVVAGTFEELGWTGFAYPRMSTRFGALGGAVLLGVMWGIWHFPVADSLGAASPHGSYFPAFLASFVVAMVAMRVLIAWVYTNTGSVLAAQLLHASSTASLVVFSAPHVTAAQEAAWYAVYALLLWVIVGAVVLIFGRTLVRRSAAPRAAAEMA